MVARTDRRVWTARIADVDTEVLHRRFHYRRQSISSPLAGKQRIAAGPETRRVEITRAKRFNNLRADTCARRRHGCAGTAEHQGHQKGLHRREIMAAAS